MSQFIIEKILGPIQQLLEENDFELVDLIFEKEGNNWFLRVYIDHDEGVDIDHCAEMSEKIGKKLDLLDPIEQSYFLEVASPGAERPLKNAKDFLKNIGKHVNIQLLEPIQGHSEVQGILESYDAEKIIIREQKQQLVILPQQVKFARLAIVF